MVSLREFRVLLLVMGVAVSSAAGGPSGVTALDELREAAASLATQSAATGGAGANTIASREAALSGRCEALAAALLEQVDAELTDGKTTQLDALVEAIASRRLAAVGPVLALARQLRAKLNFEARQARGGQSEKFADHTRRLSSVLSESAAGSGARASSIATREGARADPVRFRAMLAVGTWPVDEDASIVQMFVDFIKVRHVGGLGPTEVWYRYAPTHAAKFLEQGSHRTNSRPFLVDVPVPRVLR